MTLHKLSAGTGYEYLTRQVAALDSTEKGAAPLADYYSAKGESPGRWVGSGLVGIDGLEAGEVVTAEQMKDWARMMDIEFVHINKDTTIDALEHDLFLSDLAWKLE